MRRMKRTAALLIGASLAAPAPAGPKSGEQVYQETCAACHATRFDKAPQFADRKAWAPLIREGQVVLTAHAWVGVRNMPPQGGNTELSLDEFARAVAFMARAAGGTWQDPDAKMLARMRAEEKRRRSDPKRE